MTKDSTTAAEIEKIKEAAYNGSKTRKPQDDVFFLLSHIESLEAKLKIARGALELIQRDNKKITQEGRNFINIHTRGFLSCLEEHCLEALKSLSL